MAIPNSEPKSFCEPICGATPLIAAPSWFSFPCHQVTSLSSPSGEEPPPIQGSDLGVPLITRHIGIATPKQSI